MHIDIKLFTEQLGAPTTYEERFYIPKVISDLQEVFSKFAGSSEIPQTIMGRRILGHSYGDSIALKCKKWIFDNYPIGSAAGVYDTLTDSTARLPS